MFSFDHHDCTPGLQVFHERVGDLAGEPFLDLWPARVQLDQTCQFRKPGHASRGVGDVTHVRNPVERQQVMFTGGEHFDVAHQHHFVMADLKRG